MPWLEKAGAFFSLVQRASGSAVGVEMSYEAEEDVPGMATVLELPVSEDQWTALRDSPEFRHLFGNEDPEAF